MSDFSTKYEIIRPLGRGGMCEVMLAKQLLFDRTVAIKVLKRSLAKSEECRKRFVREAKNCALLSHKSIVTIFEIGEFDNKPFISMQYLNGGTYEQWLESGGNLNEGLSILYSVAQALQCAHGHDILHRDLKPDNVLLTIEREAKVADWGLAKMMDSAQEITHAGIVLGTPEYMSPEQIMSQPLSESSDLYSFGIMLYETVSGCLPFPCSTMTDILQAHLYKDPYPVKKLAPYISESLETLIEFLLQKNPADRMPSAELLVYELERIITQDKTSYENITVKRKSEEERMPSVTHDKVSKTSRPKDKKITSQTSAVKKDSTRGRTTVVVKRRKHTYIVVFTAILLLGIGIFVLSGMIQ